MDYFIKLAYIDPGTGSLIFQVLAATLMGLVVAFQSVRDWLKGLFYRTFKTKSKNSNETSNSEDSP